MNIKKCFSKAKKGQNRKSVNVAVYDNLGDMAEHIEQIKSKVGSDVFQSSESGWHGLGYDDAIKAIKSGNMKLVKNADKMLKNIEDIVQFETKKFKSISTVAGGVPIVPNVIAGIPTNMRIRQRQESDLGPVSIVADMVSSQGISADDLRKRGTAIFALARKLSEKRPVKLYVAQATQSGGTNSGFIVKIDSAPLDLARAANMLMEVGASRNIGYGLSYHLCGQSRRGTLNWCWQDDREYRKQASYLYAQALFCNPDEVLYLGGPHMRDDIIVNPVKWVQDMMDLYGNPNRKAA